MVSFFGFGEQSAPTPAQDMSEPSFFAEADTEFCYLNSENHHRYLATAICRFFTEGRSFVLVTGSADGDLIVRAINDGNQPTYRASVVQCVPDMDLGKLVRAYSAELGLCQSTASGASKRMIVQNGSAGLKVEPESGAIWTLISYLIAERQSGVTRMLLLKDADLLDLRCFDDLQRLALLDAQHVMPIVLLSHATPSTLAPFDVLQSPIVGRLATDHLESEEVWAFIQSQLAAFDNAADMSALFPPRIVETIAIASRGKAAFVNRLALKVVAAFSNRIQTSPPGSGEPLRDRVASSEPTSEPTENAKASIDASHVSLDQSGAAIAETEPDGVMEETPTEDERGAVNRASDKDDGRSIDTWPTAELVPAEVNDIASKAGDQPTGAETESMSGRSRDLDMQDEDRGGVQEATCEIRSARDDQQYATSEIRLVESTHDADNKSQPALALSPGQLVAGDIAVAGNVAKRAAPHFRFAVTAIAISIAAALMLLLYLNLSAFGHWQEVLRLPRELASQWTSKPETQANLKPAIVPDTTTTITKEPRPDVPASVAPIGQRPSAQDGASIKSNSTTNNPVRQAGNVTTAEPPEVASVQPNTSPAPQPTAPTASAGAAAPAGGEVTVNGVSYINGEQPHSLGVLGAPSSSSTSPATPSPAAVAPNALPPAAVPAPEVVISRAPDGTPGAYQAAAASVAAPTSSVISTAPGYNAAANRPSGGIVAMPVPGPPDIPVVPSSQIDAIMVQRGEQLLAAGDIVSARLFFERVAQTGNAAAAYGLAETYDPVFLVEIGARGVLAEPATAVLWYQRAVTDGSTKAAQRLRRLQSAISSQSVPIRGVEK